MSNWIEAGSVSDFEESDRKTVKNAVVFYVDGKFYACENRCPHMGYPMNKGTVRDGIVSCAWHNWQFDMESGGCYRGGCDDLQTYEVKVEDGKVLLLLEEPYDHFAMHAARLIEGMRASDEFLQAKAVSQMQKCGGSSEDVVMVAIEQAYRHSQINHRNFQAVYELQAICDAMTLGKNFDTRENVGVLLQGIRTAAGSSGDRMSVIGLPEDFIKEQKLKDLLLRYSIDSSALGIERLLLNSEGQGMMNDIEPWLLEIATEDFFIDMRQVFICVSAVIHYGKPLDLSRFKPAYLAWTLGNRRVEADLETKDAVAWLVEKRAEVQNKTFLTNDKTVDTETVQKIVSGNSISESFCGILNLLKKGVSFQAILNSFSLISARRFSRIPVNNGGLWNTATEGIRYCHALRRMTDKYSGTYQIKALFHMTFYFFKSRWVKFAGEWKAASREDPGAFKTFFEENQVKEACRSAIALASSGEDWQSDFLKPLLQEDNSTVQLNTLIAVLEEIKHQEEWQHYISGAVTYACDMKMGQTVLAAAKFGRSYLR